MAFTRTTIETVSGREFDYTAPTPHLDDIAHGLSMACRFQGQCKVFYSVAEHSVLVSRMVAAMSPELALPALLHDGHEAYTGDMAKPLKNVVGAAYKDVANRIDEAIAALLGIDGALLNHPIIKACDNLAVMFEGKHVKAGAAWTSEAMVHDQAENALDWTLGLDPPRAKALFLREKEALHA